MPDVFSYLRFSSPQQATGDSIRRQTEATAEWCARNNATLRLDLRDEGVSGFKGKNRENPDVHGLAAFLAAVKTGRVQSGSFLVVENLDRLSRESIVPAIHLFTGILVAGVKIVQLKPVEQIFDAEKADMTTIMLALVELSRGNSESKMKSERIGAAWRQKKKNAGTKILTRMTPGWIRYEDDKLVLDPQKSASVRLLFKLAREGLGIGLIAKKLNADQVPVLGRTHFRGKPLKWSVNVVYAALTNRATVGEYQPHTGSRGTERKPAGDPVKGYYPAVITEDEYNAVRGILSSRAKVGRGRRGKHVNLFSGLLKDARSGGSITSKHVGSRSATMVPIESRTTAGTPWTSFQLKPFEDSIRAELAEVKVKDIVPGGKGDDEIEILSGQLAEVEAMSAKWRAKMDDPNLIDAVAEKLSEYEKRRRSLTEEITKRQNEAANPVSEVWGQARTIGKSLDEDDNDEAREKYRTAVRRVVQSIWVLMMPGDGPQGRGVIRIAAAQVWFKSGVCRSYLIGYKPARGRQPIEMLKPRSFKDAGLPESLDLRIPAAAKKLEALLKKHIEILIDEGNV